MLRMLPLLVEAAKKEAPADDWERALKLVIAAAMG
jgi:hypothetical protein